MLNITWKIFPCKLRRRSRTIAKYAPSLTVSGNIASEEFFQYCILYFFQYSGNFPVILKKGCNVSDRRRSRIFSRGRDKRRLRRRRPPGGVVPHSRNKAAAGMLSHAFSQCHAWCIILSRDVISCCATPSCFPAAPCFHAAPCRHALS
jgi:hypothetical protein